MNTFLDDNRIFGSTFLLYGNTNDDYYCPDATVRKTDDYLVALLKSRGYEHIVFFGTRGAYCRDEVSARFFFTENQSIPLPAPISEDDPDDETGSGSAGAGTTGQGSTAGGGSGGVGGMIRRGRRKRGYTPGSLSEGGDPPSEPTPPDSPAAPPQAPARVRYALTRMHMSEFYPQFRGKMLDQRSRMAVVFYNVLTDFASQDSIFLPTLKDDILHNFSQAGDHNLCLIVAPDTAQNTGNLIHLIQQNGLDSKFLIRNGNDYRFNPDCCFEMCYPRADEIRNMLHRFALIGTSRGKRIRLAYHQLDQLAERILTNSVIDSQRKEQPQLRRMRAVAGKLETYIHSHARGVNRPEITLEVIDDLWDVHIDPEEARKSLDRRGWEPAVTGVEKAIRAVKNEVRNLAPVAAPQTHTADVALERYARKVEVAGPPRPKVPNFVLVGSPGTGKTTIARLIGQILYAEGLLKVGHVVEVNKEKLTNSYVAGIPKATMAQVELAEEGVLFIDEADGLAKKDGGANNEGTGVDVIKTLNTAMTDPNRHFCTIVTGYPGTINALFDLDPGFQRRFGDNRITLDDYDPDLLYEILQGMIREAGFRLDPSLTREETTEEGHTHIPLHTMVSRIYNERDREKFGNAGDMETLARHAMASADDQNLICREAFYGGLGKVTAEYFTPMDLGMTRDKVLAEMDQTYVGMNAVKDRLRGISYSIERAQANGKGLSDLSLDAILLVGNPGTGKTTVAHTLAKLYYSYGLVGTPTPIECSANEISSQYQNDTDKADALIKQAQDARGFLFVDEAHNLSQTALKAFLNPLTDKTKPFVACFAVYPEEENKFYDLDPGCRSRFESSIIRLEDYTGQEMYEIFLRKLQREGYTADDKVLSLIRQLMDREYETRTTKTGNARHAETILKQMTARLDQRCSAQGIPFTAPESRHFVEDDIPAEYRKGLSAGDNASRLEELQQLAREIDTHRVGNTELKQIMKKLLKQQIFQLRFPQEQVSIIEPGHYFFKGNAGTGKTTSLNYLGNFLCRLGIIRQPEPVLLSASRLVGQYLGQTAVQTRTLLEQNMGRLILIDEAYALTDTNQHANSYKQDAINELVAKLDDATFRKTTCVVFAGYPGDMDGLYQANQGMRSRVREIAFPDFTHEECVQILQSMVNDRKIRITDEALAQADEQIRFLRGCRGFANGRTIREYVKELASRRENRMLLASDEEVGEADFFCIQPCDLPDTQSLPQILNL